MRSNLWIGISWSLQKAKEPKTEAPQVSGNLKILVFIFSIFFSWWITWAGGLISADSDFPSSVRTSLIPSTHALLAIHSFVFLHIPISQYGMATQAFCHSSFPLLLPHLSAAILQSIMDADCQLRPITRDTIAFPAQLLTLAIMLWAVPYRQTLNLNFSGISTGLRSSCPDQLIVLRPLAVFVLPFWTAPCTHWRGVCTSQTCLLLAMECHPHTL